MTESAEPSKESFNVQYWSAAAKGRDDNVDRSQRTEIRPHPNAYATHSVVP